LPAAVARTRGAQRRRVPPWPPSAHPPFSSMSLPLIVRPCTAARSPSMHPCCSSSTASAHCRVVPACHLSTRAAAARQSCHALPCSLSARARPAVARHPPLTCTPPHRACLPSERTCCCWLPSTARPRAIVPCGHASSAPT
jgi:hypothetical protein